MFRDRGQDGYGAGGEQPVSAQASCPEIVAPRPDFAERYAAWCRRISDRFAEIDLVPDLAQDIGSRRWLRGAGTLLGLSALALAGWPDFAPVEAAPAEKKPAKKATKKAKAE